MFDLNIFCLIHPLITDLSQSVCPNCDNQTEDTKTDKTCSLFSHLPALSALIHFIITFYTLLLSKRDTHTIKLGTCGWFQSIIYYWWYVILDITSNNLLEFEPQHPRVAKIQHKIDFNWCFILNVVLLLLLGPWKIP